MRRAVEGLGAARPLHQLRAVPLPVPGRIGDRRSARHRLDGFAGIVVSPGVPLNRHPIAARARAARRAASSATSNCSRRRVPRLPPHKVVGITGTNGKSTTTALIHHILKTRGHARRRWAAISAFRSSPRTRCREGGVYVLELSSYQIDLTFSLDCDVAVLLNITPDHLDRYDGFEAYAASKARLFAMQSPRSRGGDRDRGRLHAGDRRRGRPDRGRCFVVLGATSKDQSRWPSLQGPHNAQNVAAAVGGGARARRSTTRSIADGARAPIPACRTGWSGSPRSTASCSSTTARRPTPTSTAPALAAYPAHPLDRRRARQDRRSRPCAAAARPCPRRLHDRRGRPDVRAAARRQGAGARMRNCSTARSRTRGRGGAAARSFCSRRPAPRSTSSAI